MGMGEMVEKTLTLVILEEKGILEAILEEVATLEMVVMEGMQEAEDDFKICLMELQEKEPADLKLLFL